MYLRLPKDLFDNYSPPQMFLCTAGGKIIGELPAYAVSLDAKWNAYSEASFSIDRQYVDVLTGETKVHPLFDKAEGLRQVYMRNMGYFIIQDPDYTSGDNDSKTISMFSTEYSTGSKYLENFYINTGEVDSKEVTYLASIYGENYTIDTPYERAVSGAYDSYQSYYIKEYSDNDSYVYSQMQIADEDIYQSHFNGGANSGILLYVKKYPNVRFYYPTTPELSLLHLIFEKIPDWSIGNVDSSLWRKERKFDEERVAVYDFLMNQVADTFKCVVEWDTINRRVNFYEEAEDGITEDNTVQTRFETDVYISKNNLAKEINISYSADDIKTKLKVTGSDGLTVREVNLGRNYILNLDYYHDLDWMEQDLYDAYQNYLDTCEAYSPKYTEAVQGRVSAYNKWNDLMHAVPVTDDVVLIGDEFKKLYCLFTPISTAYVSYTISDSNLGGTIDNLYADPECATVIDKTTLEDGVEFTVQGYAYAYQASNDVYVCKRNISTSSAMEALTKQLGLYLVNEDTEANKKDNVLLTLKNVNSDTATVRIYNNGSKGEPEYMIQVVVVQAGSGITEQPSLFTMKQWITGALTAQVMGLIDYTVASIGTMGAYFVLAKDERIKANLEDYGVNLLQEKYDTYMTIFKVQTEGMLSQDKYQCTASDEAPTGSIAENTMWLDTNSSPVKLYKYTGGRWAEYEGDPKDFENYIRYKDNYDKLIAVQEVLLAKKSKAEYILNGYAVPNRKIVIGVNDGSSLEGNMYRAALQHFDGYSVTRQDMDTSLPLYTFTTSKYPEETFVVYLNGTTPYVSYANSQGVYQATMNRINQMTDLEKFFTAEQWRDLTHFIREDEYSDDNFLLTGYESEEEIIEISKELMETASKELKTLSRPSLKFSMTMANILALSEFEPLMSQFQLGNFVRVHIRDKYVKRARLLEVHLNFDDLSDFSADFGDLVTTRSEIDKHAELLKQAVTAGKQVAASAGEWQKAVDKSNRLEESIAAGLQDVTLEIGKASGQSIEFGPYGLRGRKLVDGTTDQYEQEQVALMNNKLVFTADGWKTSASAFGKFTIDGVDQWGLLAKAMIGGYIEGAILKGGSLEVGGEGGTFRVYPNGSVQILGPNNDNVYASSGDVHTLTKALQYQTELVYDGSTIFSDLNDECIVTCKVLRLNSTTEQYDDITEQLNGIATFTWRRIPSPWKPSATPATDASLKFNQIKITHEDVVKNAQFTCQVEFDDSALSS